MDPNEVPRFRVEPTQSGYVQRLRSNAHHYFVSLIGQEILQNVTSIQDLRSGSVSLIGQDTGAVSACYLVENNDQPVIVKMAISDLTREAQALNQWREAGVRTPYVTSYGSLTMEGADESPQKVYYLVEEAIMNDRGKIAPISFEYLARFSDGLLTNPSPKIAEFGRTVGETLALMHTVRPAVTTDKPFGAGYIRPAATYAEMLAQIVDDRREILLEMGYSGEDLNRYIEKIKATKYVEQFTLTHGDYGPHNILVEQEDPLKIVVIDPNPRLADPYWDLAWQYNRFMLKEDQYRMDPNNEDFARHYAREVEYFKGYKEGYFGKAGENIDQDRLKVHQIAILMSRVAWTERDKKENKILDQVTQREHNLRKQELARMLTDLH